MLWVLWAELFATLGNLLVSCSQPLLSCDCPQQQLIPTMGPVMNMDSYMTQVNISIAWKYVLVGILMPISLANYPYVCAVY
jgi:hypothetical protein